MSPNNSAAYSQSSSPTETGIFGFIRKGLLQVILATTVVENAAEIVLIQYYTFYDYHMYPEAYQLLSSTTKSKQSYDNWVMFTQGIDHVKILELKPYNDYAKQFGFKTINDQKDLKVYFARISFIGKETGMKEQISQLFLKVALENGEWKILPAATSIS